MRCRRNENEEGRHEPVDQKGPDERSGAPCHPTKAKAADNGKECLQFRFADVRYHKWHRLEP